MSGLQRISSIFLLVLLPALARGQIADNKPLVLLSDGAELFKWILQDRGMRPTGELSNIILQPRRSVLILMGDPMPHDASNFMQGFVRNGGALLFASDLNCEELIPTFGSFINGRLVSAKPGACYQGKTDFPFVKLNELAKGTSVGRCFQNADGSGFEKLVSNHPSAIRRSGPDRNVQGSNIEGLTANLSAALAFQKAIIPVAEYDADAEFRGYLGHSKPFFFDFDNFDSRVYHAAKGADDLPNNGKIMLLADHSILLNQLLVRKDIDNFAFAENLVDWLKGPEKRDLCYFVYDQQVQERFDLPLPELPLPPLDVMANLAMNASNKMVDNLQKENFFNKYLLEHVGRTKLLRGWLIFATFVGLSWLLWRIWNGRTPLARGRMEEPHATAIDTADPSIRFTLQYGLKNFYPSTQFLIRSSFARLIQNNDGGELNHRRQVAALFPWYAFRSRAIIRRYWAIGYGTKPIRIRAGSLRKIMAELERLESSLGEPPHVSGRSSLTDSAH